MAHAGRPASIAGIVALLLSALLGPGPATAEEAAAPQGKRPQIKAIEDLGTADTGTRTAQTGTPALDQSLAATQDKQVGEMWRETARLEGEDQFLASVHILEELVLLFPADPHPYWRIAKNYTRLADSLPPTEKDQRTTYFTLAEHWADRGLDVDPECGECCLYKVGGLGGRLKARGMLAAAADAPRIAELLERGIALLSVRPDHHVNPELEELYYAAAQFYRTVPEWFWLDWILGVKGSRRRAVEYMRRANEISTNIAGPRLEFLVDLGVSLICLGEEDKEPALAAEGLDVLQQVIVLGPLEPTSRVSVQHAEILIAEPSKACGYLRHEWADKPRSPSPAQNAESDPHPGPRLEPAATK